MHSVIAGHGISAVSSPRHLRVVWRIQSALCRRSLSLSKKKGESFQGFRGEAEGRGGIRGRGMLTLTLTPRRTFFGGGFGAMQPVYSAALNRKPLTQPMVFSSKGCVRSVCTRTVFTPALRRLFVSSGMVCAKIVMPASLFSFASESCVWCSRYVTIRFFSPSVSESPSNLLPRYTTCFFHVAWPVRQIMRLQGGMKERAAEEARKIMQGAA